MEFNLDKKINRSEYVRLLIQALGELGFAKTVNNLELESGICLYSTTVAKFQTGILQGDWELVVKLLPDLEEYCVDIMRVKYLIFKEKYLELLEERKVTEALQCLRNEVAPLVPPADTEKLQELSCYILCKNPEELYKQSNWSGSKKARHTVLDELRGYVSPSQLVPEKRLQELILQAFNYQKSNCLYHNTLNDTFSLFEDHACDRTHIPTQTKFVLEKHSDEVWHVQFSHKGKLLASASKDATAIIWDVKEMRVKHILTGHTQPISFVSWSPDDSLLLTCGSDNLIKLWDTEAGTCKKTFSKHTESAITCAWLPDGKRFVSGGTDKYILMMDIDGRKIFSWSCARINDLAVTHDGKNMVVVCQEKKIRMYSLENLRDDCEFAIQEAEAITSLCLSQDSRFLLVNIGIIQEVHQWDLEKRKLLQKYSGLKQTRFVIRSCFGGANQAFVVSGSEDSSVYIWNRSRGSLLEVLNGHSKTVNAVSWNPQIPEMFASASDDRTIRIWGVKGSEKSSGKKFGMTNGFHYDH